MNSLTPNPTDVGHFHNGTFLPGDVPETLDHLVDAVSRNRFTTFFALLGELLSLCPEDCDASGFSSPADDIIGLDPVERRTLLNHPVFQAWNWLAMRDVNARLTGTTDDSQPLRSRLDEFSGMLGRVREAVSNPCRPSFHRLDMDPLIAAVLPPSYLVPADQDKLKAVSHLGHPLGFFRDVVRVALDRIQATWPQARDQFDRLVYAVCYLPDASFRSCSASRYTGVILISSRDASLLDLEESLVHEAGHQLLYNIVEVAAVTDGATDGQHRLPWSNQVRDLYGYFHAFFIYVLLAQFHERVMDRPGPDGRHAAERLRHILRGLVKAVPDFQMSPHLTQQGKALIGALTRDVVELEKRHRALLN
jgi:hypothetical protein